MHPAVRAFGDGDGEQMDVMKLACQAQTVADRLNELIRSANRMARGDSRRCDEIVVRVLQDDGMARQTLMHALTQFEEGTRELLQSVRASSR
jgi:hypothetical protein